MCSRIDRALGNHDWMIYWGQVVVEHELSNVSDHSHLSLTLSNIERNIRMPFMFFNSWADHKDFSNIVTEQWRSRQAVGAIKNACLKLQKLKPGFKKLNNERV